jgi:hypothetical protein
VTVQSSGAHQKDRASDWSCGQGELKMRALTVEELGFVSGGFGAANVDGGGGTADYQTPVFVRIRPVGVDPTVWNTIANDNARFGVFCNHMVGEFRNAQDYSTISGNTSSFAAGATGGGLAALL